MFKRIRVSLKTSEDRITISYNDLNIPKGIDVWGLATVSTVDGTRIPDGIQVYGNSSSNVLTIRPYIVSNGVASSFVVQTQLGIDILLFY